MNKNDTNDLKRKFSFWELLLLSTLITTFFPWSLLFLFYYYGLEQTVIIIKALVADILVTLAGITIGMIGLLFLVGYIITLFVLN
jgi:hypothetical protein